MTTECSAYQSQSGICSNGFIQTAYCRTGGYKCHACGADGRSLPHCLKDELPAHWVNDDGSPRFYRPTGARAR